MTTEPYLIKGAGTNVQPRLEIHDLMKENKQFSLFVQAWTKIRDKGYEPAAAQYGVQAGIHGMPYEPWLGDPSGDEVQKSKELQEFKGMLCTFSVLMIDNDGSQQPQDTVIMLVTILFPTWHRPSLMLLEQSIGEAARKIAEEIAKDHPSESEAWLEAADKLRFPISYWDWTDPRETRRFPQIFREKNVKIHMPGEKIEDHSNPLYTYNLGSPPPSFFEDRPVANPIITPGETPRDQWPTAYFGSWTQTYRWPSNDPVNPTEKLETLDFLLNGGKLYPGAPATGWHDLQSKVASLFLYPPKNEMPEGSEVYAWDRFSNTRAMSQPTRDQWENPGSGKYWEIAKILNPLGSIESPHNLLHLLIGGLGHMMDNDYASFDPIFFLHHCNVDRILALWETAYPDYYMGNSGFIDMNGKQKPFLQRDGKWGWSNKPGSDNPVESAVDLKGDTPLTPFRKGDGKYWTSDDTRWRSKVPKNYTYKDIHLDQEVVDPLGPRSGVSLRLSLAEGHEQSEGLYNEDQCRRNRACLQKLFGFNPVPARQKAYQMLSSRNVPEKLTYPRTVAELAPQCEAIHDYRHYVVRIVLDPHALGTSYLVNINFGALNVQTGETIGGYIGSAAALVRSKDTKCGACQGRTEDETKSVYHVTIPHEIIAHAACHSGEMNTLDLLLKSLSAEITLPDGFKVASTSANNATNAGSIPKKLIPVITLFSAALQALPDGTEYDHNEPQDHAPLTPCDAYDWQKHTVLFPHQEWTAVQAYS
ncbi:Di-copper centre-containing protein [Rhizoctonia solani]|uniref:tyrosinase n=1 Tax=Rhizoctonia solani TaxID=456999 RepID=A0A8H7H065_9AGAM|nr:Di-copper centre-containing protein [Rhizoctonia solani]